MRARSLRARPPSSPLGPGQSLSASYSGTGGTPFDLPGVGLANEPAWFLVQDASSGGSNILSTYQPVNLPVVGPLTLVVVDSGTLQNIASPIAALSATGLSSQAAQVILLLQHAGAPYQGVVVSGGQAGAVVAYDRGRPYWIRPGRRGRAARSSCSTRGSMVGSTEKR